MQKNYCDYPVEIAEDSFGASTVLADMLKGKKVFIVADSNVVQRTQGLGARIGRYVQKHALNLAATPLVLPGGEKLKSDEMQTATKVMTALVEAKLGATDAVLALGGGTVLDVAGYAASQVRGGIPIYRVPTTIAAMADAAFAEYAALDGFGVKDALRVPSHPAAVVIDPKFTVTTLDGVWRAGIAEFLRQAVVLDAPLAKLILKSVEKYRNRDYDTLVELLTATVASRQKKGTTTFSQWCAMRLQAMGNYKLPHGYAVAIAVCVDCAYAMAKGLLKESVQESICGAIAECGALEGLAHSRHLLQVPNEVLFGLDAWALSSREEGIVLPTALGKLTYDKDPDREMYFKVMKEFLAVSNAK